MASPTLSQMTRMGSEASVPTSRKRREKWGTTQLGLNCRSLALLGMTTKWRERSAERVQSRGSHQPKIPAQAKLGRGTLEKWNGITRQVYNVRRFWDGLQIPCDRAQRRLFLCCAYSHPQKIPAHARNARIEDPPTDDLRVSCPTVMLPASNLTGKIASSAHTYRNHGGRDRSRAGD
jgi:hypothetical protein